MCSKLLMDTIILQCNVQEDVDVIGSLESFVIPTANYIDFLYTTKRKKM